MTHSHKHIDVGYRGLLSAGLFHGLVREPVFLMTIELTVYSLAGFHAIWLRSFLNVGLFITAHDAMHGTLYTRSQQVNHDGGAVRRLYAGFSYKHLLLEHHKHHRLSGTLEDPDFADDYEHGFFRWLFSFMMRYCSVGQMAAVSFIYLALLSFDFNPLNVILFWAVPAIMSALQLFYFGTYRPHRIEEIAFEDEHRARSMDSSNLYSFLTCYHFGYHLEHHRYPWVPCGLYQVYEEQSLSKRFMCRVRYFSVYL